MKNYIKIIPLIKWISGLKKKQKKMRSISKYLAFSLTLTSITVSVITVLIIYQRAISEQMRELRGKSNEYRNYLQSALERPMWTYDDNTIRAISDSIAKHELVVALKITDQDGKLIYDSRKNNDKDILVTDGQIKYKNVLLGTLELSLTKQIMKTAGLRLWFIYLILIMIISLSIFVLTQLFLGVFLKKPIDTLEQIISPYAKGVYDRPIPDISYVEFQAIWKTVSEMGEKIRFQMNEILSTEAKYRQIVETAAEGIWVLNSDAVTVFVNDRMAKMLGYRTEDMIGKRFSDFLCSKDLPDHENKMKNRRSGISEVYERRLICKDGKVIWVQASAAPIYNKNNEYTGSFGMFTDITGRKEAEFLIQEKNQQLAETLTVKETLIHELFHRTKNSLQLISSMLFLQAKKYKNNNDLQNVVNIIKQRIMTISLVYDMLFQHNNLSRISVKEFIRKLTHSLLSSNSGAEKIKLVTEIDDLFLLIDTIIPLGLIMNELINNSIRHAFSEIKEPLIKVSMTDDGNDRVILTYVDNGIGLPEDFEFKENTSIGINLIQNLGEYQMHGQVSFGNGPGFNCKIIFPQNLYKERV